MYEVLMNTVRTFFGSGLWKKALEVALPVVVLALIAWSNAGFRAWFGRMKEAGTWQSLAVGIPADALSNTFAGIPGGSNRRADQESILSGLGDESCIFKGECL